MTVVGNSKRKSDALFICIENIKVSGFPFRKYVYPTTIRSLFQLCLQFYGIPADSLLYQISAEITLLPDALITYSLSSRVKWSY